MPREMFTVCRGKCYLIRRKCLLCAAVNVYSMSRLMFTLYRVNCLQEWYAAVNVYWITLIIADTCMSIESCLYRVDATLLLNCGAQPMYGFLIFINKHT